MTLTHLAKDLRFSLRLLWKNPGFTLVAVLSLALGIGLNATVFTWCKAAILDPLPGVPDARSLILGFGATQSGNAFSICYPDYADLRDQNTSFEGLAVFRNLTVNLSQDGKTDRTWACLVSGNYLDVLHVKPLLGRSFLPEEDRTPSTHPVVLMSYNLWQSRFHGNPDVVGSTLTINGKPFTVIGVTPKGFVGGIVAISQDLWIPMMMQESIRPGKDLLTSRGNRWLQMIGRLKPGVSLPQAQANLKAISAHIAETNPTTNTNWTVALYPLTQSPEGASKILGPVLLLLMGIVSVVLLVACTNVANLFMIKATNRRKEISIRIALGASRWRIINQLLVESMALSVISGVVGLFIAVWTAKSLLLMLPTQRLPIYLDCSIDQRVLLFTFGITLATGLLFGLIPALQTTRFNQATTLKDEGSSVTLNPKQSKLRGSLVSLQVALSLVALITAGLFVRSVYHSVNTSPGFSVDQIFVAALDVFPNGYDQKRGKAFFTELLN
ncbi:MAG TPA: ABC transporter permease, partial [Acidobacteriota bacterium]|nr:ABC transporter permease [Acidobacteriota bacterium]